MSKISVPEEMFPRKPEQDEDEEQQEADDNKQSNKAHGTRRYSMAQAVEGWGAVMPFDSLSHYMLEQTLPVGISLSVLSPSASISLLLYCLIVVRPI